MCFILFLSVQCAGKQSVQTVGPAGACGRAAMVPANGGFAAAQQVYSSKRAAALLIESQALLAMSASLE